MSDNKFIKKFKISLEEVAKELGKDPREVTKAEYTNTEKSFNPTDWELRRAGSFTPLKKLLYGDEQDIVNKAIIRNTRSYKNKLDKEYGNKIFFNEQTTKAIEDIVGNAGLNIHKPVKSKPKKNKYSRTLVAHLSDTHYGCNIDKQEVGGVNSFNWQTAARRTALFADQIASYKPQYRKDTDLVVVFNGDMIAGVIHDQEWVVDLLATQFSGGLDILTQFVSFLANEFKNVRVHCNTGNHGRAMHKSSKSRATSSKWDSYETMMYVAVKNVLESNFKNVEVNIPIAPFDMLDVQGHKLFSTHGDTVINVGNPGSSLNINSISNQINKINASVAKTVKDEAKIVMVGHVHTPMVQLMDNGVYLVINGCLSGLDPFANSIGIFESHPTQQLFEVTKEHAVGDFRMIQVKEADEDKSLDKIIKPFEGKF